jgi:mRNA interferase MazF
MQIKRGEIYYAALDPVMGSETGKTRPVLIVQNDVGNQYSPTTIIAVITDYSNKKETYPICVVIDPEFGLKKKSIANFAQIRTIDRTRLTGSRLGTLTAEVMEKADLALKHSLGLS